MKLLLSLTFLAFLTVQNVHSAKILFLLPVASKSHVHVFEPLIRALGERGHEVTNLSPMNLTGMPPTVKQIVAVPITEMFKGIEDPFIQRQQGKFAALTNVSFEPFERSCREVLDTQVVKDMVENETFDLVIVDTLLNYCVLGLVPHYKAPYIYVSTLVAPSYMLEPVGTRLPPSFVPSPFLELTHRMSFFQRVLNLSFQLFCDVMVGLVMLPKYQNIYMEKLGIMDTISEIDRNVSMVFSNSHFTLTYPRPLLPDVVEVGGMHARPAKALPKDLDDFLSGAEHGFIFFSLGSIVQANIMPEQYRKIFLNVFSRLKQRVIWKWETETMPDLPKNVKLSKWLPQQDILGHKNIRMFITHGGLLSIQETVYHGVPLIGIPLFADQDLNVKQAENAGFSLTVEIVDMTEEILESKIKEVLENPRFTQRAKELSALWKDQPQTPLETAVFWSEYVIRHKGAPHLRSPARDLNFFQYHSIDVVAFIFSVIIGSLFVFKCLLKCICNKLCGKSSKSNATKIKTN